MIFIKPNDPRVRDFVPPHMKSIAVLGSSIVNVLADVGGGISGLASAWHLTRVLPPSTPITVFEASSRTGGWVKSVRVQRPGGSVLVETGPHLLRVNAASGYAGLELVKALGLQDEIIWVNNTSVSSEQRYFKYQDRLVQVSVDQNSSAIIRMITEPLFRKAIGGGLRYLLLPSHPPKGLKDESVATYARRRFNDHIARYFMSPMMHGIYAGDYEKLSMRSTFLSRFWDVKIDEKQGKKGPTEDQILAAEIKAGLGVDLLRTASRQKMYTFRDGLEALPRKLKESLEGRVNIRTDSPVQTIQVDGEDIKIRTPLKTQSFSHVFSTLPLRKLFPLLPSFPLDLAQSFPTDVTVGVVNLYYPSGSVDLPIRGFGYLIPQSTLEENPEAALGVAIVSDGVQGQDTGDYKSGVKLRVLMGGHNWRDRRSLPSDDELLATAVSVVAKDLKITVEPTVSHVSLQRECIPQYEVGHWERTEKLNTYLDTTFGPDKFKIVGTGLDGVGVNMGILSARKAARSIGTGRP